jgi:AcrR family transcriptional regulator
MGIAARGSSRSQNQCEMKSKAWNNLVLSRDEQLAIKRQALLQAAGRAFSRKGFHNTSLDDVAKVLGVTKAAIYYYVKNKQELLFECHKCSLDLGDIAFKKAEAEGKNSKEILRIFLHNYIEMLTNVFGPCGVLLEDSALRPADRKVIVARRDAFSRRLRELISAGQRDGSLAAVDPKMTELFLMGAVNWLTRWYSPEGALTGNEIAGHFITLLFRGITPRPANARINVARKRSTSQ